MQAIFYPKYCICIANLNKTIEDALIHFIDNIYVLNLYSFENNIIKILFNSDVKCLLESSIINSYYKTINVINSNIKNNIFYTFYFVFNKNTLLELNTINYFDQKIFYKYICKYIKRFNYIECNSFNFLEDQIFTINNNPDGNTVELLYKIRNKYK